MTITTLPVITAVLVGSYTGDMGGRGSGVTAWRTQPPTTTFEMTAELVANSPSYLTAHPTKPWVYAASEGSSSSVLSLHRDGNAPFSRWGITSAAATGGEAACHLALSPDLRHLVAANYGSGSIASFAIGVDGTLSERRDLLTFSGSGPDPDRQSEPHAHQVVWDGPDLLVCDLGTDAVHRVGLGPDGVLTPRGSTALPAGSGPRHGAVIGDHLVVACELSAELWVGARTPHGWVERSRVPASASPARNHPSALVADGNRVFVGNRGPDTVAVFDLEPATGVLRPASEFPSGGRSPRDLTLSPGRVWVANQDEDRVVVFDRRELPAVEVASLVTGSPACVVLPAEGRPR